MCKYWYPRVAGLLKAPGGLDLLTIRAHERSSSIFGLVHVLMARKVQENFYVISFSDLSGSLCAVYEELGTFRMVVVLTSQLLI